MTSTSNNAFPDYPFVPRRFAVRAGIAMSVNKRVHSLISPMPKHSFRLQGAAHSRVSWRFESLRSEQLRRQAAIIRK